MEPSWLFALAEPDRTLIREAMRSRRYARNEFICHEGDPGDCMYVVRAGHVAVRVTTMAGDQVTLSVLGPGDAFGELALVGEDGQRTATVLTLEPTVTSALTRAAFDDLRRQHAEVDRLLVKVLAARIDALSHRLLEALYEDADRRVIRRLLDLAALYGQEPGSPAVIPLIQADIATLAGATRPTTNQTLRGLASQGLIELRRGSVRVLDPDALSLLADS